MIEIRPMTSADCEKIAALEATLFSDGWNKETLQTFLQGEYNAGYVLFHENSLAAYALFQCLFGEGELLRIGTTPEKRRMGFAERLFLHFVQERRPQQVFLEVRSQNEGARRLYEKLGFASSGRRQGYYKKPADDAILYQIHLNQK